MPELTLKLDANERLIGIGQDAAEASRQRWLAKDEADRSETNAAFAEEFSGPAYASQAAGEAATTEGQFFRVPIGTTPETYTRYQRTAGGSVEAAPLAPTLALAATSDVQGSELVGFKLPATDAVARTLFAKAAESPTGADFGMVGDGITDNTTALGKVRDYLNASVLAGNKPGIRFLPGRYVFSTCPNLAAIRAHLQFEGEVWFISTAAGSNALLLDGGASGAGVYNMRITGFPQFHAPANGSDAIRMRAVHRSYLEIEAKGAGSTSSGLQMEWCVSNTVHYLCNTNSAGFSATPARGMNLTIRDAEEETSYNTFVNPELSGMALGGLLDGSLGNMFVGGAVQGNTLGLQLTTNAWENKFTGTDFEENDLDVTDASRRANYIGCDMNTGIDIEAAARGTRLLGGRIENVDIASGARGVDLATSYNRTGSGTIADAETRTRYSSLFDVTNGEYVGGPKSNTALTVTTGDWIYANNSPQAVILSVAGGTVSYIAIAHGGNAEITGLTSGMFVLPAGDTLVVGNTVVPTVRLLAGGLY